MSDTNNPNWWKSAVTYQVYPRSFQDDNSDGIGDIKGITRRLDYIASLGVDAVWLSPIFTSPMTDMGYDVSNYTDIDPLFGTLADFDAMVERAHELGLKVVIDQVLSHSSDQHEFFQDSKKSKTGKYADWYVWADPKDDGSVPNTWPSVFGGSAWEWVPARQQYYLHNFLKSQPDFNIHNKAVQDWLLDTMDFWLKRGVDGFRFDTVNFYMHDPELRNNPPRVREKQLEAHNPYDWQEHIYSKNRPENLAFLERIRTLMNKYDARTTVGEVGDSDHPIDIMAEYTAGETRLHSAYSFEFLGNDFNPEHFRSRIETFFEKAPDGTPGWSFSNHDVIRHLSRWLPHTTNDTDLAKQAAALLLAFEGAIYLYQGEELGQLETDMEFHELTDPPGITFWPEYKGRDGCRTPMVWEKAADNAGFSTVKPWLPVKAPQASRAVDIQENDTNSVLAFYREMIKTRKNEIGFQKERAVFFDVPAPLLAFRRGDLLCIYNLSKDPQGATVNGAAPEAVIMHNARVDEGQIRLQGNAAAIMRVAGDFTLDAKLGTKTAAKGWLSRLIAKVTGRAKLEPKLLGNS